MAARLRALLLALCVALAHGWSLNVRPPPPRTVHRAATPTMGVMDLIRQLFYGEAKPSGGAGEVARSRLRFVLASDRTGLDEATMEKIRMEIKDVVSKYVVIDEAGLQFDLVADDDFTLVTASFPVRARPAFGSVPTPPAGKDVDVPSAA